MAGDLRISSKMQFILGMWQFSQMHPNNSIEINASVINSTQDEATVKIPVYAQLKKHR
jgi:hypothetical protein